MRADIIVVGSGIAGLSAALAAAPRRVLLLTPGRCGLDGASHWAQGGIAAALAADDSPLLHAQDTLAAGADYGDPARVLALTQAAPDIIDALRALGAELDLDAAGRPLLGREAAHSRARIVHARGDGSGAELMRALRGAAAAASHIEIREGWSARGLLLSQSRVGGVLAEDAQGRRYGLRAGAVVLATGGIGQLFRYTTNPAHADGSGLALALQAGAALADLEFVQFHPTALAVNTLDAAPLPLLTEALRGAGAVLVDGQGRRFMAGVPGAELAPRDVVARAVYRQLRLGPAYLDARDAVGADFPSRFPSVYALARARGLDPCRQPLPVAPAVHYHMGGVAAGTDGRTGIDGLYAVGEVACTGVHGANRLASNSLLEGLVFGRACGRSLREAELPAPARSRCPLPPPRTAECQLAAQLLRLRQLMWESAGIERTAEALRSGLERARELLSEATPGGVLAARAQVSVAVLGAALARPQSLGAHFRADELSSQQRADRGG
jgi:L-aspartate oxidase